MKNDRTLKILLSVSAMVNIILAGAFVLSAMESRRQVRSILADNADRSFLLQSRVLADLESGDPARIQAAKRELRESVMIEGKLSYIYRTNPRDEWGPVHRTLRVP